MKTKRLLILVIIMLVAALTSIIAQAEQSTQTEASAPSDLFEKPLGLCPVMGGQAVKDISCEYNGEIYYFCCSACVGMFEADPEKYIAKLEKDKHDEA